MVGPVNILMLLTDGFGGFGGIAKEVRGQLHCGEPVPADRFATWSNISNEQSFVLPNCVDLNSLVPEVRDEKLVERYGVRNNKLILTVGRISFQERYEGFGSD